MTTAVFSVRTLKVPRAFWQWFDAPGKEKKKKKPHPSPSGQEPSAHLGHHVPARGCPSWSQGKARACCPVHPMAQHTFLLKQQLRWLPLNIGSYRLILPPKIITCPANPSHVPNLPWILESHYDRPTTPSRTVKKGGNKKTSYHARFAREDVGIWVVRQVGLAWKLQIWDLRSEKSTLCSLMLLQNGIS